ncbi:MAG: ABC transporter ATP-binding protein [Cephaloticoccus sp.]|nr:ABC transporter ATP-binding protein [Cephaloticoccus sp.]
MSHPVIEVSGLSKRYVIQHETRHDNLRDTLHHSARKLWRRFRWGTGFETEEFWALRDVSFSVQPGEVLGIIGRNGAGKSTLLKILSRITEPTLGSIKIRGRVASLLEVGTGFHPELSGRENIFLNGAILGMSRAEIRTKFDEIVAFAEVERFLDTPVKRYSSGMYVRLAFAVAAHLDPEILIIDEVLAVGDIRFQRKCLGKMQDVATSNGRTVLFVSHQLAAVRTLCPRSLLLANGKLVAAGPTTGIIERYEDFATVVNGDITVNKQIFSALMVNTAKVEIIPEENEPSSSQLLIKICGDAQPGGTGQYGFAMHLTTVDGIIISRIGPRLLKKHINAGSGKWCLTLHVPKINHVLVGGRYELNLKILESLNSERSITDEPFLIEIPESDPFKADILFNRALHGLVPLPVFASLDTGI